LFASLEAIRSGFPRRRSQSAFNRHFPASRESFNQSQAMRIFRHLKILFDRWRYTGTIRAPRPLTLAELEALAKLFKTNKSNL
jgi:hypothetical protein